MLLELWHTARRLGSGGVAHATHLHIDSRPHVAAVKVARNGLHRLGRPIALTDTSPSHPPI